MRQVFAFSILFLLAGCKSVSVPHDLSRSASLSRVSESFSNLLPLTLDPAQFAKSENQTTIHQELDHLAHFSHDPDVLKSEPAKNPNVEYVKKRFKNDVMEADRQLKGGNRAYARFLARKAMNACMSCHALGADSPFHFTASGSAFEHLNALERTNYLITIHRDDQALAEYKKAMSDSDVTNQPYTLLENVTLRTLAVAVRTKRDPKLALEIVDRLIDSKWAPVFLQLSAGKWRNSILEWQAGKRQSRDLSEAARLVSIGWKKQTQSPMSRGGLIEYLRASSILQEILHDDLLPNVSYAEALYNSGLVSESLKDIESPNTAQFYYEACVRRAPHSEISKNCYLRLENIEMLNFSQFETGALPEEVRSHLSVLKEMAQTGQKSWRDWDDHR